MKEKKQRCHFCQKSTTMPRKRKLLSHLQPSPSQFEPLERERRFILDCVATDRIEKDYSHALPKLGSVIPFYDAQQDPHATAYFASKPVLLLFQQMGQVSPDGRNGSPDSATSPPKCHYQTQN